jgi:hypothetical protein
MYLRKRYGLDRVAARKAGIIYLPGRSPDEDKETYTAPRDELDTSDEVVLQGRQDYATEKVPRWPAADSARQYIATPEGRLEIQHVEVTWPDAARGNPEMEDVERKDEPGHRRTTRKSPDYEL